MYKLLFELTTVDFNAFAIRFDNFAVATLMRLDFYL